MIKAIDKIKLRRIKNRCEKLSRLLTAIRAEGKCERCGNKSGNDWAHYITRANKRLKYHPLNTRYLCHDKCHPYFHKHPAEFQLWMIKKIGEDAHNNLIRLKNELFIESIEYYQWLIKVLENEIKKQSKYIQIGK